MDEILARIAQLENNMNTLISVRRAEDERNSEKIEDEKADLENAKSDMEETAVTVADFLAEYYLSQLGIDDFDMEGGEEE